MSVLGKHIVISGGGSGVGATLARVFCKDSANVTILGRRFEPLRSVASETGALPITCDITDRHALEQALKQAREKYGPISVSVANAGQSLSAPFQRLSPEDFSESLAVNLMGVFHLWQTTQADMIGTGLGAFARHCINRGSQRLPVRQSLLRSQAWRYRLNTFVSPRIRKNKYHRQRDLPRIYRHTFAEPRH